MSDTPKKHGGFRPPPNEALLIPQIASLLALGKTNTEVAQALSIGYATVKRLAAKDECKAVLKDITNAFKDTAKAVAIKQVSEMTQLAVDGLKTALREGNIQAIQTHFKVIGLLGAEEQTKGTTGVQSLTVVLPGASIEKEAIEVESESHEEH